MRRIYFFAFFTSFLIGCSNVRYSYDPEKKCFKEISSKRIREIVIKAYKTDGANSYTVSLRPSATEGISSFCLNSNILSNGYEINYLYGDSGRIKELFISKEIKYQIQFFPGGDNRNKLFEVKVDNTGAIQVAEI